MLGEKGEKQLLRNSPRDDAVVGTCSPTSPGHGLSRALSLWLGYKEPALPARPSEPSLCSFAGLAVGTFELICIKITKRYLCFQRAVLQREEPVM